MRLSDRSITVMKAHDCWEAQPREHWNSSSTKVVSSRVNQGATISTLLRDLSRNFLDKLSLEKVVFVIDEFQLLLGCICH